MYFREGLIAMLEVLEHKGVLVYCAMTDKIFGDLKSKTQFVQYPDCK